MSDTRHNASKDSRQRSSKDTRRDSSKNESRDRASDSSLPVVNRREYLKATGALTSAGLASTGLATANGGRNPGSGDAGENAPLALRVNHEQEPNNLPPESPDGPGDEPVRFFWEVPRDTRQTAYRVLVASDQSLLADGTGDVWDSGRVESPRSVAVPYDGDPLAADATYYWSVRVWDENGDASAWSEPAAFSTAIPDTDAAWEGTWIGQAAENTLPGADWADYTFESDFTIENDAVGFVFRAGGPGNYYMWQVVLQSSPDNATDTHLLRPHVWEDGSYRVLTDGPLSESGVPIDDVLEGSENAQHRFRVELDGDSITSFIDGQQVDERTDDTHATGTIGFRAFDRGAEGDERAVVDDVLVTDADGTVLFADDFSHETLSHFSGGTIQDGALLLDGVDVVLRDDGDVDTEQWTDYTLETDFTVVSGAAGVLFRVQDADNLYMWQINTAQGPPPLLRPHVRVNGTWSPLPPVELGDVMGDSPHSEHHLRIEVEGDQFTTFVDGQQVDQRTDGTHPRGGIGFRQYTGGEHARYDDLTVTAPDDDVLFADDFSHEYVRHFSDGEIDDGELVLDSTGSCSSRTRS